MDRKERFFATIAREPVDRPASWLGLPTVPAIPGLYRYFGVDNENALKEKINDDVFPVEVPYRSPAGNHIACAFDFAQKGSNYEERTLTAPGFFENYSDPGRVDDFDWPDPGLYIDRGECLRNIGNFQDACAAFGMETALMKMLAEREMFTAVIDRITDFYLKANEIFYENTKGELDAVLLGNDFGSQTGLMVDPDLLKELVFPDIKKLIVQAKNYGLKVVYHSCGSIFPIIDDLIDLGVDVIHPIQALAKDMEPQKLKTHFGDRVSFCGGVDAQYLLVNGSPGQVEAKVNELKEIFPTGLIISPSHEAILPDIPPANVKALFDALK